MLQTDFGSILLQFVFNILEIDREIIREEK